MRNILFLALGVLLAVDSFAATRLYTRATQPATCTIGDLWVDTDGTAGEKLYICESTNTWIKYLGVGPTSNPSFLSLNASGGNLAAANKQVTKAWATGLPYTASVTSVIHGGKHWIAKTTHTAGSTTEPGVGASYADAWEESGGGSMSWPASDGAYYAAKDGAWASLATIYQPLDSDLTTFSGLACTEGQIPKKNSSSVWVCGSDVEGAGGGISHATSDGNYYASRNGAWASLTGLFAAALGTDDNYVTDAEKTKLTNLSGTNSGDNAVNSNYSSLVTNATHSGDVTGSTALTIANSAVTLAKMANMATGSLIYRKTASAGAPEVQTLATLKTDLGLTGTNSGDQTTITGNAGTASALAANGANCSAGQAALGVDASGAAEGCWTPSAGSMTYPSANNFGWTTNGTSWTAMGLDTNIITGVSASDDTVPSAKAVDAALALKANASSIAFEAATWSDLKILDTTHTTAGTGIALVQDSMAYANADDAYHLWSIDKVGSELAGKQATISFGTGVQTALGVNVGSAGAPVLFNGAGGTPTSLTLTNALLANSTSLPGTCTVGQVYQDTDADTDGDIYFCRATNTWKAIDDDGGAGGLATTDIDTSSELRTLVTDESGTGALLFAGGDIAAGTATTATAGDNDTSIATTAFVQTAKKSGSPPVCAVIPATVDADDYPIFKAPAALTITASSIKVYAIGGTNVVGGLDECTGTNGTCGSVTAVDSDITGTAGNEVADDGTLTNGTIASGNWVRWHTTSVSGSNTSLSVCFSYTLD